MASAVGQALAQHSLTRRPARYKRLAIAELGLTVLLLTMDLASIIGGVTIGYLSACLRHNMWVLPRIDAQLLALLLIFWFVYTAQGWHSHLYAPSPSMLQARLTERILRISCFSIAFTFVEWWVLRGGPPGAWFGVTCVASVALLLLNKHASRTLFRLLASLQASRKVLIVGTGRDARRIFTYLLHFQLSDSPAISFVDETGSHGQDRIFSHDYQHRVAAPVHRGPLTEELLRKTEASEVYLADPLLSAERAHSISDLLLRSGTQCSLLSTTSIRFPDHHATPGDLDGIPVLMLNGRTETKPFYELSKRLFDVIVAAVVLIIIAPALLAVALLVRLTSKGPILFRQQRVGRHGRLFTILKFRSMYVDVPQYGRSPEDSRDPRITPVGRFLRKTSLDEIPQFLNVLFGDMSLVGPRPEMPYVVEQYSPVENRRLQVAQGLTGLWQLSADRKYSIHESIEYDLYYVQHRTYFLDMAILLHTFLFAVKGI